MRDPLKDPMRGDAVMFGPQWQRERYDVFQRDGDMVGYIMNGARLWTTLRRWQEWCSVGGEVVRLATPPAEAAKGLGEETNHE